MDEFHASVRVLVAKHCPFQLFPRCTMPCARSPPEKRQPTVLSPLDRPNTFRHRLTSERTDRAYREACRQADILSPRWARSIFLNHGFDPSLWVGSPWKPPSFEMALAQRRPSRALAKGHRVFWHNQLTGARDRWCSAATRGSRSRRRPSHRRPNRRDEG